MAIIANNHNPTSNECVVGKIAGLSIPNNPLCDIKINVIITAPKKEMKAAADAMANLKIMGERMPAGKVREEYFASIQTILNLMAVINSRGGINHG